MGWFKESQNNNFIQKVKDILKEHSFTKSIEEYYHFKRDDW